MLTAVLMAVGEWAILAGPVWATPPTLDGGEWTSPAGRTSHRQVFLEVPIPG